MIENAGSMRNFIVLLVFVFSGAAHGAKFEVECPEGIKTIQRGVAPGQGWSTYVDKLNARQIFAGLSLSQGPPKDGVTLFPEESTSTTATQEAPPPQVSQESVVAQAAIPDVIYKIPQDRETHVICQYTNTLVRLTKKVPKGIEICRVRFSETIGHIQKAICD
jgi:hypothetical protein